MMIPLLLPPGKLTAQPQAPLQIDWSTGILDRATTVEVLLPSVSPMFGAVSRKMLTAGANPPKAKSGQGGVGAGFAGGDTTSFLSLGLADSVVSLNKITILILRSLNIAGGSSGQQYGYNDGTTRIGVHCPYSDNVIYWDYANSSTGRCISPAQTWVAGVVDAIALVAGPTKGREIWRNGAKIASSAATDVRSTTTKNFNLGAQDAAAGGSPLDENVYQVIVINDEISDARIRAWSANPWQIFKAPARRMWLSGITNSPNLVGSVMYIG